jgi:aryl-alcohol dehydrogenase-like predicted oxidoreductase
VTLFDTADVYSAGRAEAILGEAIKGRRDQVHLTTTAWLMLQRNLLYTAVTRAKRLVVLVGSTRAIARAVRTQGAGRRYAALAERLRRGLQPAPGNGHQAPG